MSYLSLEFWESDVNVAGNHSTLHVNVTAHLDSGHNAWSNYATTVSFNCAGQNGAITVPSYNIPSGGSAYLGSGAFVIKHRDDGTYYDGDCSASWNTGTIGALSGSGKFALTAIPRATQPTVSFSDGNHRMGTSMTVNLPAASSTFTHTISYGCVNAGGLIATGAKGSVNWVIPKDLAYQIPAVIGGKAQVQVAVDTYSGGTHIGTKSCWFDVMISDDMRPSLGSLTIARVDNGVPSTFGLYVQGISKATLTANNGQGSYGSQVVSCAISGAGFSSGGSPTTFGPFATAGTMEFSATVTDSRGRTASKTVSIVVYEYKPPTLMFTAQRCTSSGLVSETGAYILVKPVYSCASVNGRNNIASKSFSVNGSSNTTVASGSNCVIGAGSVAINKQWDVIGMVTDLVGNKAQITVKVGTSKVPFNIRADANGAAFGKYSEVEDRLESIWPIYAPELTLRDKLDVGPGGINTGGIVSSGGMKTNGGTIYGNGIIELFAGIPFIDFHYGNSPSDYTSRLLSTSDGSIFAYNVIVNASDRRYKKDIIDLNDDYLQVLKNLKPKTYHYIKNDNLPYIGLIAQEVIETFEECGIEDMPIVSMIDVEDRYGLDYAQVGTLAIYGWQKHDDEINNLKEELKNRDNIIEDLLVRVKNLEQK